MKIGFIGLGAMGSVMAGHLLKAGHALTVWNRSPDKAAPLVEAGARRAASPAEAAAGAEVVITSLADDAAVEQVVLGEDGLARGLGAGAVHVGTSTISPKLSERLADAHAKKGQGYVAAPVLGRPPAAAQGKRQGSAAARPYYYTDDQGLTVITAAARAEHEGAPNLAVSAQAVLDHINIERGIDVHADTGGQPTGHIHDVDAVTSASVTVLGGDSLVKNRVEGSASAALTGEVWDLPVRLEPSARVSIESDYHSYSGRLQATAELFERNTTISAFAGYGHDRLDPTESPPGESELWPASHDRVSAGALLSQLLSRRIVV